MAENVTEDSQPTGPAELPAAVAVPRSGRTVQLVWLIPLIAALIGGWLAIRSVLDRGPVITITFKTAEGLEAGKTKLKYKDVEMGQVTKVVLAPDLSTVIVTAELVKGSDAHLHEDTQFWVVRPRISGGSVSGISTLLSGAYIGVGIGKSKEAQREFTGLEVPPIFPSNAPGREYVLRSPDLGSLDIGSPVYFRRLQVGQITGYEMDKDGNGVTLRVFVNAPYEQYVSSNTRFWHASGVDFSLDASGIKVDTQSVVSIVLGGLAFQTPVTDTASPPAPPNAVFEIFPTHELAMKHPDTIVARYRVVFHESLRGLAPGAPVDFRGITIGEVATIETRLDMAKGSIELPVEIKLYPERLLSRQAPAPRSETVPRNPKANMNLLVSRGLRAQVRTGNLLTGQLFVAFDFFPNAPKAQINWNATIPELPTIPGDLEDLKASIASVAKKLDRIDYEGISADLKETLKSTTKIMATLDASVGQLTPEAKAAIADARRALVVAEQAVAPGSPLLQDSTAMMSEITRAARAFRILADYLEQHPEALISGKKEENK